MDRKQFLKGALQAGVGLCCCRAAFARDAERVASAGQAAAASDWITALEKRMKEGSRSPAWRRIEFAEQWLQRLLDNMDTLLDKETRSTLMQACGRSCFIHAYGVAPEGKPAPNALDDLLAAYQNAGRTSVRRDGNTVYFEYSTTDSNPQGLGLADAYCLCPFVESGPERLSATYCQCSAGYVGEMFERLAGAPVKVEVLESLRTGGKLCRFKIEIKSA